MILAEVCQGKEISIISGGGGPTFACLAYSRVFIVTETMSFIVTETQMPERCANKDSTPLTSMIR